MNRTRGHQADHIAFIRENLSAIGKAVDSYRAEKRKIEENQHLSQEGRGAQLAKIAAAFAPNIAPHKEKLAMYLDRLEKQELENAAYFDANDQTMHSVISLLGAGVPLTDTLAEQLSGQHQTVALVREFCRVKGIPDKELARYSVDIPNSVNAMRDIAISDKPDDAYNGIIKKWRLATAFADSIGVTLNEEQRTLDCGVDDFHMGQVRAAMGLMNA